MIAIPDLSPRHLAMVRAVLAACLPPTAQVFVFGSRATGRARRGSDLDLAIDAGRPLTRRETLALAEGFDASDLPWRVDVVDLQAASEGFEAIVARDRIALPGALSGGAQPAPAASRARCSSPGNRKFLPAA